MLEPTGKKIRSNLKANLVWCFNSKWPRNCADYGKPLNVQALHDHAINFFSGDDEMGNKPSRLVYALLAAFLRDGAMDGDVCLESSLVGGLGTTV